MLVELVRVGLPVPLIGSGRNHYQMVSIEDCARAGVLAWEHGFPGWAGCLGSVPDRGFVVDTTRARDALGWRPTRSDRELMLDAYDHWLQLRTGA